MCVYVRVCVSVCVFFYFHYYNTQKRRFRICWRYTLQRSKTPTKMCSAEDIKLQLMLRLQLCKLNGFKFFQKSENAKRHVPVFYISEKKETIVIYCPKK